MYKNINKAFVQNQMTKLIILMAILITASSAYVFAEEKLPLNDTPYYYQYDDKSNYIIYDSNGNIISENEYDVLKTGGGKIIARMLKYSQHYGIMDVDFNIILEPRFSQINYNENTETFECLTWGEGPDKIEFFDLDMKSVPQPRDIRKLEGTDCYYERVIDETAEINDGYISYYICDEKGGRLSPTEYIDIKNVTGKIEVTNTNGTVNTFSNTAQLINRSTASQWAQDSINTAIEVDIVPKELQNDYTKNITRQEFCRLAVKTYMTKTGYKVDNSLKNPFEDVSDEYVTAAYSLGIVSGTGKNKFSPNNAITRQEAAVMLNNLADLLNMKKDDRTIEFIDEKYFAQWAKESIYSISSIRSGNTYIMTGTEANKFSPWMNYTREQAVATMLRLYNCREMPAINDGQYKQVIGSEWLYCEGKGTIYRVKKDGSDMQTLVKNYEGCYISFIADNKIYYYVQDIEHFKDTEYYKMNLDGTEQTQISKNDWDNAESFVITDVYDEKYKYYLKDDWSAGMRSPDLYITKSDHNGNNETRIYNMPVAHIPILYDGYIFSYYGNDILRIDKDGNCINLLENIDLNLWDILKIEDGVIYYRAIPEEEKPNILYVPYDHIYAVNIDGSNNRLIFSTLES